MSKRKSIKSNFAYNLIYQVLLIVIPLISMPYLARVLGADGIGNVSYIESIVSYFVMFASLGIQRYGQREISYFQNDIVERSRVFWNTKIFSVITSSIVLILYLLFVYIRHGNSQLYRIFAINIINVMLDVTWLFQGMEDFGKIVLPSAIVKIVGVISIFAFIRTKNDLNVYALWMVLVNAVSNLLLWPKLSGYISPIKIRDIHPFSNIKTIIALFIPTIAIEIYTVLDRTMIGILTHDSFQNGYYEQAQKVVRVVLAIITALGTVMVPRIGALFKGNEIGRMKEKMYESYQVVWLLGVPMCLGMISVSSNFVPWFYGDGYDSVISLLHILPILFLSIGINNVTGIQYLIPTKRERIFTITVIVGAFVNLCMNMLLIPRFQAIGAAIASVAAETVIAILQFYYVRKEIDVLRVLSLCKKYLFSSILMYFVVDFESRLFQASIVSTIVIVLSGVVVYLGILFLWRDEMVLRVVSGIIDKAKVKKVNKD